MAIAPLFVKYKTKSGNSYVYDSGTNEIVHIGELPYRILDDFHVLTDDEIIEKHHEFGEKNVRTAIAKLEELQTRGILCDHTPQHSLEAEYIRCQGKDQSFRDFLKTQRRFLVLELTQECNLRCEYCCYGEHYPGFRKHGDETMSLETAKNVVEEFVTHCEQDCNIGFYGGEPWLEPELLKQIVLFAKALASQSGKKMHFSMTTNGTMLSEDKIHFLVEHAFHVLISMDGNKESHDRYRVFRNESLPEHKRGSHDVIIKNMKRFVNLYPDYTSRGIALTFTATSEVDEVNNFLRRWRPFFPSITLAFVRPVSEESRGGKNDQSFGIGFMGKSPCESGSCKRNRHFSENYNRKTLTLTDGPANDELPVAPRTVHDFCNWTKERQHRYLSSHNRFISEMCSNPDADAIRDTFPLLFSLFERNMINIHFRPISSRPGRYTFSYRCYPGAVRTFCSSQGILYPCERLETVELYQLGDGTMDVDGDRALRIVEVIRLLGDCGNCVDKRFCTQCPAQVSTQKNSGKPDALAFQKNCWQAIADLSVQLEEYTTVMESNQSVLDKMLQKQETGDWLEDIEILLTEKQQELIELGVEELEDVA